MGRAEVTVSGGSAGVGNLGSVVPAKSLGSGWVPGSQTQISELGVTKGRRMLSAAHGPRAELGVVESLEVFRDIGGV